MKMDDIVSLCKRRGFIWQGSDVYGGMAGTWDFGPLGVALKKKIMDAWWKYWVEDREDMYGVDAAIIMNPRTWIASGHTATFADPLVECGACHGRFRADKIADGISESVTTEEFKALNVKCPTCGKTEWGDIRKFNMMFQTHVGPVDDDSSIAYLRPETAQGIFTNYKNVVDTIYPDLPFGLAQQGKAFRNEISPRDFILRDRECSQMEIEYFVDPKTWEEHFEKLLKQQHEFLTDVMGLEPERIHDLEVSHPFDLVDVVAGSHVFQLGQHLRDAHFRENNQIQQTVVRHGVFGLAYTASVVLANGCNHHEDLSAECKSVSSRYLYGFWLMGKQRF